MTGRNHPLYGKHHSENTKHKISIAKKGKRLRTRRLFPMVEIQKAYESGVSLRTLASRYKTDKGVIGRRLRELGVTLRSARRYQNWCRIAKSTFQKGQAMTYTITVKQETLPADAKERKQVPLATGCLDYFPSALVEVAKVSFLGNQQHNPGEPLHWARAKSTDQADTIIRHFIERGKIDTDGMRHSAKMAWRALALLQLELEAEGAPLARGASN
jgi:hypothetical protein